MRCGALIAAAGVPAEVEQFLPMVKVGGTSVIKRQIQGFQRLGIEPIVVVTGYHAALLERHLARSGVICVRNRQYASTRMLESIWLGMDLLEETDAMLITPGDVPYLHADTLRALLAAPTPIAVPQHGRRLGHPVLVKRECYEALREFRGERGLNGFIRQNDALVTHVPVDDRGVLMAVNTEEGLAAAHALHTPAVPDKARVSLSLCYGEFVLEESLIRLLRAVESARSLRAACAELPMSYSRAWVLLGEAERALGVPLLIRKLGGTAGGGSELTQEARSLVDSYARFARELEKTAARILEREFVK